MNVIQELKQRLSAYQGFKLEENETGITVIPESAEGFTVSLEIEGDKYLIYYDAWHEYQENAEDAIKSFMFGLSDACRLKVSYAGEQAIRWMLEIKDRTQWGEHEETGLIFYPFWKRKSVRYLSNNIVN